MEQTKQADPVYQFINELYQKVQELDNKAKAKE